MIPEQSADATPVAETLAGRCHAGRNGRSGREVEEDSHKKYRDHAELWKVTNAHHSSWRF